MSFSKLGLSQHLLKTLSALEFTTPYPIQEQIIPKVFEGKDVLGIAKTGSGKTASFVLPILQVLENQEKNRNRAIEALILVPTRELANQVQEVILNFSQHLEAPIKSKAVFGGVAINPQMKGLMGVRILVATPGRLIELVEKNALSLSEVKMLVLDEADKMLNLGFKEEMDQILRQLPKKRQNLLFSATLSDDIQAITQLVLRDPVIIKIEEEENIIDLITQSAFLVSPERKGPLLRYLIKEKEMKQVLVFVSSTYQAENVADKLRKNGIHASSIHSKKSQQARTKALQNFKNESFQVLVATDIIGRGIDIQFLPFVINYELPRSPKDYIHRIGRTGRAENPGEAIALITPEEELHFKVIQKKMKKFVTPISSDEIDLKGY
ncbi:MAG: DEAD/DEAH box helicase [Bacteroidota bacterium]